MFRSRRSVAKTLTPSVFCGKNGTTLTTGLPALAGQFGTRQARHELKFSYFTGIAIFEIIVLEWDLGDKQKVDEYKLNSRTRNLLRGNGKNSFKF